GRPAAGAVADVLVVVAVVVADDIAFEDRVALRRAGGGAVGGDADAVAAEPAVVDPHGVATRTGEAHQVVVAVAVGDLQRVTLRAAPVGQQVLGDARVPVAVGLAAVEQAMVAGPDVEPV